MKHLTEHLWFETPHRRDYLNITDSGVDFVAVDLPHADKFTVGIMALVAEKERDLISERTKAGLAAAKRRGTRLGNTLQICSAWAVNTPLNQFVKRQYGRLALLSWVVGGLWRRGGTSHRPDSARSL